MPKNLITLIFALLLGYSMHSQTSKGIHGKVIDSKSGTGIAFTTISLKDSRKGVIADENGGFVIPNTVLLEYEFLVISCIGYKTKEVPIKSLKQEDINVIKLNVSISKLDEVLVKAEKKKLSARQIVKKAIQQIPNNYPNEPFSYVGYYRDYQKESNTYINLNESLVEIHDRGFHVGDREQSKISLLEYKENSDFQRQPSLLVNYDNMGRKFIPKARIHPSGGNELTILMAHDAIRNYEYPSYSFMYIMKKHFIKHHKFELTEITQKDGENLYVIDFKLKPVISADHSVSGQLFVNRNTFAIHKLDYTLSGIEEEKEATIFNLHVEYAEQHGLMYLNYISFNNTFNAPNPNDFFITEAAYNPYDEYLKLTFSNPFSYEEIYNLSNYKVTIDHVIVPIKKVQVDALDNKKIRLSLDFKNQPPPVITDENRNRLEVEIGKVTDTEGRLLGKITFLTYQQYRELFVQEVHTKPSTNDVIFIDKFKPLQEGDITKSKGKQEYWMNTPLKAEH